MVEREASCACGQLRILCGGDPARVAICHCLDCQRRTGSAFGVQAWFPDERVRVLDGEARGYARRADSGREIAFNFCPTCGTTLFWRAEQRPGLVAVAVGAFADPSFPKPGHSAWERRRHPWTADLDGAVADHSD